MEEDPDTRANGLRKGLISAGSVVASLLGWAWLGLKVKPRPFPLYPQHSGHIDTIPLPQGLPAPVERFYRATYGDRIPVINTVVITGRGTMRISAVKFPARFRFTHVSGRDYRHYFELTLFGIPVMKVNEYYVDGKERMELPVGVQENNPKLDQGGNLGMWAELLRWVPATLLTDPRVRWESIDDESAFLIVPFEGRGEDRILVRFDPVSGQMRYFEVMRYKGGEGEKVLWINGAWFDDGGPWAVFEAEEIVCNVDVDVSFSARGL